ncbi:DUF3560 domain-containing protein [Parvimonas micra]
MNKFIKYCPNVWVAECEEEYEKGDLIFLETKYGKEVECEVYNFLGYSRNKNRVYSVVRLDESYAERKARRYSEASLKNIAKSNEKWEQSQEGKDFLSLAEPIKIGHHSEKKHRALIERNMSRMAKAVEFENKAKEQIEKAEYWENKANQITLAMPDSLEYFKIKLEQAELHHKDLKDNPEKRQHSYDLTYAKKAVNELKKKVEIAEKLWGDVKK